MNSAQYAVVIPAYRPAAALVKLVGVLAERTVSVIVVVDDGSGPEFDSVFAAAMSLPRVHLVRHAANQGKGAALKSGIAFALDSFPGLAGVVTADADGQHDPEDIERVAVALAAHPDSLVLGSRAFTGRVPLRSRLGNAITRGVMHALVGCKLADTQTGLRGIPASFAPLVLRIDAPGYELEIEMLITAHHSAIPIQEEPIRTIYESGNVSSHFNPLVDSMKIYFVLLRFTSVSLATAALDNLVFYLMYRHNGRILESQIAARFCAMTFQYIMLRQPVFHSRRPHRDVLPKFMGLVIANGGVSYGAIRWATAALGVAAMPAKLAIETLLFFANFILQRAFVFRVGKNGGAWEAWRLIFPACVVLVAGVECYGFWSGHLFSQTIWYPDGYLRMLRYTGLFVTGAVSVLVLAPWMFVGAAVAFAASVTALAAGPLALLAPAFFLISAGALGSLIMQRREEDAEMQLFATLVGVAGYIFLMSVTARLPVHYPGTWAAILMLPIAMDRQGVKRRVAGWADAVRRAELRSMSERAVVALLAFVLGIQWLVVLQPEIGTDGLAMHLAIPANIAAHHAYTIEPGRIIWAVFPLATDWTYAIVYLLGGELGARLLNFAFLLLSEALLYTVVRRWLVRPAAWLFLAAAASTPLAELVTGSLFVENMVATLVLGAMAALWRFTEKKDNAFIYASAVLSGTAIAAKFGASAVLAAALPLAIWETRRRSKVAAVAAVLVAATAIPGYAIACWKTGNPFFPYLNRQFPSPLLAAGTEFRDMRYAAPIDWRLPFALTFETHRFLEGQDGGFGFQFLLLLPLTAGGAFLALKSRDSTIAETPSIPVSAAVAGIAGGTLIFISVPNARYLYPVLPLVAVGAAAAAGWMESRQRLTYQATLGALAVTVLLNIWFLPSAGWYNRDFYLRHLLSPLSALRAITDVAPLRSLTQQFHAAHPGEPLLLVADEDMADVAGDAQPYNWHSTVLYHQIFTSQSMPELVRLLRDWKIRYVLGQKREPYLDYPEALRQLLAFCVVRDGESRDYYFARLDPVCEHANDETLMGRIVVKPLLTVKPGQYDDFDAAIRYVGNWAHGPGFAGAYRNTVSFVSAAGAKAELAFEGRSLVYVFTKAFNRGMPEVTIDGERRAVLDLYSPQTEWQARKEFCCFGPGRHVVAIVESGRKNAASSGEFVDVDALIVKP